MTDKTKDKCNIEVIKKLFDSGYDDWINGEITKDEFFKIVKQCADRTHNKMTPLDMCNHTTDAFMKEYKELNK